MLHHLSFSKGGRALIITAAFVIVVAGIRTAEAIMVPFLLAAFIAIISAPPLFWLQQRGVPMLLAMLSVMALVVVVGLSVILLVGTSLDDFVRNLPFYQIRLQDSITALLQWLQGHGLTLSNEVVLKYLDPRAAMGLIGLMVNGVGSMLAHSFLVLLTVIFILFEASTFPAKIHAIWQGDGEFTQLRTFLHNVQSYIAIKTSMSLATGVLVAVWLVILRVDYPVLWGVLAFLLNYVPNIGSLIAALPAIVLALIQGGPALALYSAGGYLVINAVIGNVIEPRLLGRGLGLSTLVVFLSLVFWGWVLGPVGMLLSVPLTMTVKIALESSEDTRWVALLLSSEVPPCSKPAETQ